MLGTGLCGHGGREGEMMGSWRVVGGLGAQPMG